jgi:hypothetical protein
LDGHCLQQLEECHVGVDSAEIPYPETNPTYELNVMFMSFSITERCLNTMKVVQGKGKN